jgi:hypothetical protein
MNAHEQEEIQRVRRPAAPPVALSADATLRAPRNEEKMMHPQTCACPKCRMTS